MRKQTNHPKPRKAHPARGARLMALLSSVTVTGGLAVAMAEAESTDALLDIESEPVSATATSSYHWAAPTTAAERPSRLPLQRSESTRRSQPPPTPSSQPATTVPVEAYLNNGIWLGAPSPTRWGDVQVEVTIADGRIVAVSPVQIPSGRLSSQINDQAAPLLEAQAIAIQGAQLDTVSGATYTSWGYVDSLQSALDEATTETPVDQSANAYPPTSAQSTELTS